MTTQAIRHAGTGVYSSAPPAFIEIEEPIARKLSQLCAEQQIPMNDLVSSLLRRMLLDHRRETKDIVEKFRCHPTP